jgi:hypothetical protein
MGFYCCFGRNRKKLEFKRSSWLICLQQRGEEGEKSRSSVMATMEEEDEEDMDV